MKSKTKFKIMIDILMSVALLVLMAQQLVGEKAHEWLGVSMFVLFITHNILNLSWYQSLPKGKYSIYRIFKTAINIAIFLSMIGSMVSGIILSRHVFTFLPISGGAFFARTLHILCAYWGFVLMSLHIGFHWSMIVGMIHRMAKNIRPSRTRALILCIIAVVITAYGIYAFTSRQLGEYMLLKTQFVFFDFNEPLVFFFADYFSIMFLFAFISFYLKKGLEKLAILKNCKA